jgi:hypothetical protein
MSLFSPACKLRTWKRHTCCACGCVYRYLMERSSQGNLLTGAAELTQHKMETEADVHPCPTCGLVQPDMAAQASTFWHAVVTCVAFLAFFFLGITGSIPSAAWADTAALVGAGFAAVCVAAHLRYAFRDPNRDRDANRRRAADEVAVGLVEVVGPGAATEPEPAPRGARVCRVLAVVAAAGAVFVFLNQRAVMRSLPLASAAGFDAPVLKPGDTFRVVFDGKFRSVNGYWRGSPTVTVLNEAELGINPVLGAAGNSDQWSNATLAKCEEQNWPFTPAAKLTLPKNAALAGKTLRVRVTMPITYPVSEIWSYREDTIPLTKEVTIPVGSAADVRTYWNAWGLAAVVGPLGSVAGGLALCFLGVMLRARARPTELEPITANRPRKLQGEEAPASKTAPAASALPQGAIATAPSAPRRPGDESPAHARAGKRPLPYFHLKMYSAWHANQSIYRVYLTERDFLFVHLGVGMLTPEDRVNQTAGAYGYGLIPALVARGVSWWIASLARDRLDRLNKSLAAADEQVLREFVREDADSFVLPFAEVRDLRLEEKTFWASLWCSNLVAFLKMTSASRGELTLALVAMNEMATVVEELRRVFGDFPNNLSLRSL